MPSIHRPPRPHRKHSYLRLALAAGLALLAEIVLPAAITGQTRALWVWNVALWAYLLLLGVMMGRATHSHVSQVAREEDRGAVVILLLSCLAAVMSVAALVGQLGALPQVPESARGGHLFLVVCTIVGAWILVGSLFALHYARLYFASSSAHPALVFPGEMKDPVYLDFLYFSFTISVASQTSDVAVTERRTRRWVLLHSVFAFFFNVAIVGLSINIAASLIRS